MGIHSSGNVSELHQFFPSLDQDILPQDYFHTSSTPPSDLLMGMIGCAKDSIAAVNLEIVDNQYQLDVISSSDCKGESVDVSEIPDPKHARVRGFEISPTTGYHSNIRLNITKLKDQKTFLLASFSESFFADPFELDRIDFEIANVTTFGNVDLEVAANSAAAQGHFVLAEFVNSGFVQIPFHVRYQPPQVNKSYETVTFMPPVLISVQKPPCFKPMIPKSIKYVILYPSYSCFYYQKLDGIDFKVPIGNSEMSDIITNATFLAAMTGVLFVVVALVTTNPALSKLKKD